MTLKVGQLVQSIKYGDYHVVVRVLWDGQVITRPEPFRATMFGTLYFTPDRLRLVGNNYKPRSEK